MSFRTEPKLTPVFRLSWPNISKPGDNGKYSLTMIFPPEADLKDLKKMVVDCIRGEWGEKYKIAQLTLPFKDGNNKTNDEGEVYPEFADATYCDANTKFVPTVLDGTRGKRQIPTADVESEVYAGCYCIAQIAAYAWEYKEEKSNKVIKRGVSFQLENLMKYKDGERLGGGGKRFSAEDAFAGVEVDASADDPSNYNLEDLL